jgi:hypothetical protein
MYEEDFYKNVEITSEDKIRSKNIFQSKGIVKHILIKKYLLAWHDSNIIKYSEIASTYRYDKRIRYTLFKYISYLEEFYRAIILDNYYNDINQNFWIIDMKKNLKTYNDDLNQALERLEFSKLISQARKLPEEINVKCCFPKQHISKNAYALRELRNAVMHNKFLLLYKGFDICYVEGVDGNKSNSLKANIINLINFLPNGPKEQCIIDINACKDDRNKGNDTKWDLPSQVVVSL